LTQTSVTAIVLNWKTPENSGGSQIESFKLCYQIKGNDKKTLVK